MSGGRKKKRKKMNELVLTIWQIYIDLPHLFTVSTNKHGFKLGMSPKYAAIVEETTQLMEGYQPVQL